MHFPYKRILCPVDLDEHRACSPRVFESFEMISRGWGRFEPSGLAFLSSAGSALPNGTSSATANEEENSWTPLDLEEFCAKPLRKVFGGDPLGDRLHRS
jgi:hypothetical protein